MKICTPPRALCLYPPRARPTGQFQEEVQSVHRYWLSELIAGKDKEGETLESTPDGVIALGKYRDWLAEQKAASDAS